MTNMDIVDIIYKNMNDDTEAIPPKLGESEIRKFFTNKTILASGVTGFLGKCLLEKLLKDCNDVKKIYILLQSKENMTMGRQMDKLFQDAIFDKLRRIRPNFMEKVVPIEGDTSKPNLGLSEENQKKLIEDVNIIYQNGTDLELNEKLPTSLKIDLLGTKGLLDFALNCKQLAAFIYISTAYSHGNQGHIEEVFYPAPADIKMALDIVQADSETIGLNDDVLPTILGQWPNIYTFTKASAEDLVREYGRKASFSCAVYRPSLVMSSYKEPLPGWCEELNGPAAAFTEMGLGYTRIAHIKDENLDIVPVDMCTNALLALTWEIVKNKKYEQVAIFNYGSSRVNPITLRCLCNSINSCVRAEPSVKSVWYPKLILTRCYAMYILGYIIFNFIPSLILDIISLFQGNMPTLVLALLKKENGMNVFAPYAVEGFSVDVKHMAKVWDKMVPMDQELFFCDLRELNWEEYCCNLWRGIRIFSIKDPMDTLEEARKRDCKLRVLHYIFNITLLLTFVYFKSGLLCSILNVFLK